jgi:galactose mutarotase-like enzyme
MHYGGAMVVLTSGPARLAVSVEDGGRWTSLQVHGHELLGEGRIATAYPPVLHGCFVMAPYAGRVRNATVQWRDEEVALPATEPPHALHGTVLDRAWDVLAVGAEHAELAVELPGPAPFLGRVVQTLSLTTDGLRARVDLQAQHDMPATVGLHPWFRRRLGSGDPAVLDLSIEAQYERVNMLPTGRRIPPTPRPWDDCFLLSAPPVVRWPGALSLELRSSHRHWMVFDELDDVLCVEPQTGPPDAFRLGEADVLAAGESLSFEVQLTWHQENEEP